MTSVVDDIKKLMEDHGISQSELARRLEVTPSRISEILNEKDRSISLDTAIRLAKLNKGKKGLSNPSVWLRDEIKRQYLKNKQLIDSIEPL